MKVKHVASRSSVLLKNDLMMMILFRTYELLKLYIIYYLYIPCSNNFLHSTKLYIHFLINSSLYPPNFGKISNITVKIRQFQFFSLMHISIVHV